MKLEIFCLGILFNGKRTGYEIHKLFNTSLAHIRQASFGALYPALSRLEIKNLIAADLSSRDADRTSLGKRVYHITEAGRENFVAQLQTVSASESVNSSFLSAMYFADHLSNTDISLLIAERLANLEKIQRRLLALPLSSMTDGQRFTIRYSLTAVRANIDFLKGEGKAIQKSIARS
ncbi:MAG: hypothetical protein CMM58_06610 [Rhodospirillaceae bacterium]|nr:hypothetical protein [Rhodospirillaceae bacterium]|tara:strand:+ start:1826 stop:2356 length:531 start_codon:yes stop_codon:yes gene_type:complete